MLIFTDLNTNRVPTDRDTPSPEPLATRGVSIYLFIHSFFHVYNNNNNNYNYYLLKLGYYPVAVVILHVNKT